VDSDLGYTCMMLELDGGRVIECLVQALSVIKDLDIFKDGGLGCLFSRHFDPSFRFALTHADFDKISAIQLRDGTDVDQRWVKKRVNPMRKSTASSNEREC
jgi:hypothetical protein